MDRDGPKVAPREPKRAPRWPPEGPRVPQDGPKRGQDEAKMAPHGARSSKLKRRRPNFKNIEKTKGNINVFEESGASRKAQHEAKMAPRRVKLG